MDKIWREAISGGGAGRRLTFKQFQDALCLAFSSDDVDEMKVTRKRAEASLRDVESLFSAWNVSEMNGAQYESLLGTFDEIMMAAEDVERTVSEFDELNAIATEGIPLKTLFWERIYDSSQSNSSRMAHMKIARTPFAYQAKHAGSNARRIKDASIGGMRRVFFTEKNADGTSRPKKLVDRLGHGVRGESSCSLGYCAAGDGNRPVEIITIPRFGAKYQAQQAILNIYAAHQQLCSSSRFPMPLGQDSTHSDTDNFYLYEHLRCVSVRDLVRVGGVLNESAQLFRFIATETLRALIEIDEQCTMKLDVDSFGAESVFVAEAGTKVVLGGLRFGGNLPTGSRKATLERESLLVSAYGSILEELLEGNKNEQEGKEGGGGGRGGSIRQFSSVSAGGRTQVEPERRFRSC